MIFEIEGETKKKGIIHWWHVVRLARGHIFRSTLYSRLYMYFPTSFQEKYTLYIREDSIMHNIQGVEVASSMSFSV